MRFKLILKLMNLRVVFPIPTIPFMSIKLFWVSFFSRFTSSVSLPRHNPEIDEGIVTPSLESSPEITSLA